MVVAGSIKAALWCGKGAKNVSSDLLQGPNLIMRVVSVANSITSAGIRCTRLTQDCVLGRDPLISWWKFRARFPWDPKWCWTIRQSEWWDEQIWDHSGAQSRLKAHLRPERRGHSCEQFCSDTAQSVRVSCPISVGCPTIGPGPASGAHEHPYSACTRATCARV